MNATNEVVDLSDNAPVEKFEKKAIKIVPEIKLSDIGQETPVGRLLGFEMRQTGPKYPAKKYAVMEGTSGEFLVPSNKRLEELVEKRVAEGKFQYGDYASFDLKEWFEYGVEEVTGKPKTMRIYGFKKHPTPAKASPIPF